MKEILIAGFGQVAMELAHILPSDVYSLTGVKRSQPDFTSPQVSFLRADLSDASSLSCIAKKTFDYLIYCPSPDKRDKEHYYQTYFRSLENLLNLEKLTQRLQKIIFVSSTSVYGQTKGEWVDEESPTLPEHFTGQVLLEAEGLLLARCKKQAIILRFGGIYGKQQSRYLQQIKQGKFRPSGVSPRYINRIHIKDCASSIKHLIERDQTEKIYLGVDDEPAEQKEVALWLVNKMNLPFPRTNEEVDSINPIHFSNKRCKNYRLRKSGYTFLYPNYKMGYAAVIKTQEEKKENI